MSGSFVRQGTITLAAADQALMESAGLRSLEDFLGYAGGERICHKRGRSVVRLQIGARAFYLKRNRLHPVEFWKGLSRLRLPRREALREWHNILAVAAAQIPTVRPVAFGETSCCGVETASFTLTEELYGARPLDEVIAERFTRLCRGALLVEKRTLIRELAALARRFHGQGFNHQDFYLNHFFVDGDGRFYLLDLQRVQRRTRVPLHYLVKDLAQLAFSARRFPAISRTDRLRFLLGYRGERRLSRASRRLLARIDAKVARIARHDVKLTARRRARGEMR